MQMNSGKNTKIITPIFTHLNCLIYLWLVGIGVGRIGCEEGNEALAEKSVSTRDIWMCTSGNILSIITIFPTLAKQLPTGIQPILGLP